METVLITGGSGLIGRALVQRLAELGKYEIVSLSSRTRAQKSVWGGVTL